MENNELENLISFVREFVGNYPHEINLDTRVSEDLGLEGDDAIEFLHGYSKMFNVDISEFPFDKYFCSEGFELFTFVVSFFRRKSYLTLTVRNLMDAISEGKLLGGRNPLSLE